MDTRLPYVKIAPDAYQAMIGLERYVANASIEPMLAHLVKLRASQINGCVFCIDKHARDLRAAGESEERVYGLTAWHESPLYSARERAALQWTEAVTQISQTHAPDDAYQTLHEHFSEKEVVDLTWLIAAINAWNRMAISFRTPPAQPRAKTS